MLSRIITAVILMAGLFAVGCERGPEKPLPPSKAGQILGGEHLLRKMAERTETNSSISGGFFLFFGALEGGTKTKVSAKFAWEMNDGVYAISSLPIEKIRIKLDEGATTPTIKFRWSPCSNHREDVQGLIDSHVIYAVVTVRGSDWPMRVDLPLNSP